MNLTIAINCRQDPMLVDTIKNIEAVTTPEDRPDVLVVFDGRQKRPDLSEYDFVRTTQTRSLPKGTSFARHIGITEARHEAVITCDSHVVFTAEALHKFKREIDESPNALICAICEMIGKEKTSQYYGADIFEYVTGDPSCAVARHRGERVAVAAKWRKEKTFGKIDCIMGGCYGLSRSTYIDCGEPWQYGKGWGCDEESAAVAWAACGYACILIDTVVGHYQQVKPAYRMRKGDIEKVWYNRYRVATMVCNGDKDKLMDMISFMATHLSQETHTFAMKAINDVGPWIKFMSDRSGSVQNKPKRLTRKPRSNSTVVVDHGIPCRKCSERHSMRVTHTWKNGTRRAVCKKCGTIHTIIRN